MSIFRKCFLGVVCFLLMNSLNAQQKSISYVLEVKGVNSKSLIKEFDSIIEKDKNLIYKIGYGIPRFVYLIKSLKPITIDQLNKKLPSKFSIVSLKQGELTSEQITLLKMKNKTRVKKEPSKLR